MHITECVVATVDRVGKPTLFCLVYANGTVPGPDGLRHEAAAALQRNGVSFDPLVIFEPNTPGYHLLKAAALTATREPITLNGFLPTDPVFRQHLSESADFILGSELNPRR